LSEKELYLFSYQEKRRIVVGEGAVMYKHVLPVLGVDVAVSLGAVKPTDNTGGSLCHGISPPLLTRDEF
jgi:hypothetical protein